MPYPAYAAGDNGANTMTSMVGDDRWRYKLTEGLSGTFTFASNGVALDAEIAFILARGAKMENLRIEVIGP
jgi:hypothetical protein